MLGTYQIITIDNIMLFIASFATLSFFLSAILVKNKPKVSIEPKIKVKWSHAKDLWRHKFTSYNIIMVSVFLGVSWAFLS